MKFFHSALATLITIATVSFSAQSFAENHKHGAKKDIVDMAASSDNLKTLVTAVKAADLVETLKGDGPFTVFAPTDKAFEKLPKGVLADLLKPENKDTLKKVLTYHVVSGKVMSSDIKGKKLETDTVEGSKASIDATKGVKIEGAKVTKADVGASNGVIHIIDTVILPPEVKKSLAK